MKRVVVTGLGCITPIGNNVAEYWDGLKKGKCGIDEITLFDTTGFEATLAAEVKNYNPEEYFDRKELRNFDRFSQFAVLASREAFADSKLKIEDINSNRAGVIIGSGLGGLMVIEEEKQKLLEKGPSRVSPLLIPRIIGNIASGNVSIDLKLKGISMSTVTACASGTHAIGEAYRYIKYGEQDIVLCGGTESNITPLCIAGFSNMKALSTSKDKLRASIPFDKERNGFIMGEGAGIIVLEELEHAIQRGAKIYAEMVGYGWASDSYHLTAPDPEGRGAADAMKMTMEMAGIEAKDVTYINAHGTSTHINDRTETNAIKLALRRTQFKSKNKFYKIHDRAFTWSSRWS